MNIGIQMCKISGHDIEQHIEVAKLDFMTLILIQIQRYQIFMYPKSGTIVRAHKGGDDLDTNSFQKLGNKV